MEKNQVDMKALREIVAEHGYADFQLYKKAVERTNFNQWSDEVAYQKAVWAIRM